MDTDIVERLNAERFNDTQKAIQADQLIHQANDNTNTGSPSRLNHALASLGQGLKSWYVRASVDTKQHGIYLDEN